MRWVFAILAVLALVAGASPARAQGYPNQTILMVVPFSAGGPTDVLARLLAQRMSQTLGQQVIVENITGAGGMLGSARVARAAPDGYTMVMGNLGTHAASLGLYQKLGYDPRIDFEPVMLIARTPMVLVARKSLPADNLQDFIAYLKSNPGRVTNGTAGIGSISHLATILFTSLTQTSFQVIPYRGLGQAVNDLVAGQIDVMFDQVVTATPHIESGAVKPIVVAAPTRAKSIPRVPSSAEAGLPAFQTTAWTALFLPKRTPKFIVDRVNAAVDEAMRDDTVAKRMEQPGADQPEPSQRTPEALGALMSAEIDKWVPIIREAGVVAQ